MNNDVNHYDDEPTQTNGANNRAITKEGILMLIFLIALAVSCILGMVCIIFPEVVIIKRIMLASLIPTGVTMFIGMVFTN